MTLSLIFYQSYAPYGIPLRALSHSALAHPLRLPRPITPLTPTLGSIMSQVQDYRPTATSNAAGRLEHICHAAGITAASPIQQPLQGQGRLRRPMPSLPATSRDSEQHQRLPPASSAPPLPHASNWRVTSARCCSIATASYIDHQSGPEVSGLTRHIKTNLNDLQGQRTTSASSPCVFSADVAARLQREGVERSVTTRSQLHPILTTRAGPKSQGSPVATKRTETKQPGTANNTSVFSLRLQYRCVRSPPTGGCRALGNARSQLHLILTTRAGPKSQGSPVASKRTKTKRNETRTASTCSGSFSVCDFRHTSPTPPSIGALNNQPLSHTSSRMDEVCSQTLQALGSLPLKKHHITSHHQSKSSDQGQRTTTASSPCASSADIAARLQLEGDERSDCC